MAQRPGTKVIFFMSGYKREAIGENAAGAHFLEKSFTPSALLSKIRRSSVNAGPPESPSR